MLSTTYYPVGPAQWGMPQGYAPAIRSARLGALVVAVLVAGASMVELPTATTVAAAPAATAPAADALAASTPTATPAGDNRGLVPVSPQRVLDTRSDYGGGGSLPAFGTIAVNVTAALGVAPSAVAAVALNVTVTRPQAPGFLTVWPGGARPVASTINFVPGHTVPNGVLVGIDAAGNVSIFAGAPAPVDVLVDVTGWVPAGAGFTPVTPVRVLETRAGSPGYTGGTRFARNETRLVDVVGRAGLPAGQVGAVAVNLTVTGPTGNGYLKTYPSNAAAPPTSSLNFAGGQVVANSQVLGVGPDGAVAVFAYLDAATDGVDVVIDVTGWFSPDRTFHPIAPQRLIDTRQSTTVPGGNPLAGGKTYLAKIDALASLPRGVVGAVALNITVTQPSAEGFLTVWPLADTTVGGAGGGRPPTSFVNFGAGQTVANTVIVGLGAGVADLDDDGESDVSGSIGLFVNTGNAHVVIDVTGWFPQDTFGLVADGVEARRYSMGVDRVAVVGCTPAASPFTGTEVSAINDRLAQVAAYYNEESQGRYVPQYTWVGVVTPGPGSNDSDCQDPATASGLGTGFDSELVVRRNNSASAAGALAYGLAGPGFTCADPTCARGTFPDNGRDGIVTLNTLIDTGTVANGTAAPFWMIATHEFGHTLDWPHSYTGTGVGCWGQQYDNPLDVMSRPPSGSPPSCGHAGDTFPTAPQHTIAINRYAAGWLSPSLVAMHHGPSATYTMGIEGSGATELVIVPSTDGAAFTTLEVRAGGGSGPDSTLQASGVVVHRVDQRADPQCFTVFQLGLDRCSGLDRRVQPFGAQPDSYAQVFGPGAVIDLGGVTMSVLSAAGGTMQVQLTGLFAGFGHIPSCGRFSSCASAVLSASAATPAFVCLVGSGSNAGRDIPAVKRVSTDIRSLS